VSKVVEPPVLVSKVLTFTLATSIVVLAALVVTLGKMIPLERPEVFFLHTPTRTSNLLITPMTPNATNNDIVERYKDGFIREYVMARNSLNGGANSFITRTNWDRIVKQWSAPDVYNDFTNTTLYKKYTFDFQPPAVSCSVNFANINNERAIIDMGNNEFEVNFVWVCKDENIGGQPIPKNYKIQLRIQSDLDKKLSGVVGNLEKLRKNPLGIQVTEYTIKNGEPDPLNSDLMNW